MIRRFDRRVARLALVGPLAAALALSACGRKGPLDAPPSAAVVQPNHAETALGDAPADPAYMGFLRPPQPEPAAAPAQPGATPPPPKKRIFLDWLL